ncbi:MAG: NAD-dependent epimerase/dehydratase family protein [Chloroflexi bacterium]|nr:NAD-dependent epimerase/dehydratase family protein [Chloroflexota bacterium]
MANSEQLHVVFGASGALGNAVVRELVAQSMRVRGVTRSGNADVPNGVEMIAADALLPERVRAACDGASVIYNCANAPYTNWPKEFPPIMQGIIDGASAAGAKLVFGDNLYSYGPVDGPLTEDLQNAATGRKGRTRTLMADMLMEAHASGKLKAAIGRGSDFYGPRVMTSAIGDRVIPAALAGKGSQVLGNPDTLHTYTYVPDFARALVVLGERDEALGEIWHVPNAKTITTREMLDIVYELAGHEAKVMAAPKLLLNAISLFNPMVRELKETYYQFDKPFVVDHSKFKRAFGAQVTPHREALTDTIDWYRSRSGA